MGGLGQTEGVLAPSKRRPAVLGGGGSPAPLAADLTHLENASWCVLLSVAHAVWHVQEDAQHAVGHVLAADLTHLENASSCCYMVLAHKPQLLIIHSGESDETQHFVKQRLPGLVCFYPPHGC